MEVKTANKGRMRLQFVPILMGMMLLAASCKDKTDPTEYDRTALTANLGERVIVPAYDQLQDKVDLLRNGSADFRVAKDQVSLDSLQSRFAKAWLAWKACSAFEFGPAATASLRSVLNTFPCDTLQIHNNFTSGAYDLNQAVNLDARGFQALDFLLHGLGSGDAAILNRYQSPSDSSRLTEYLEAVVSDIQAQVSNVRQAWNSGYLATFKASLGTDVGSSTSMLVNELNRDLEIIKTASIGIPLGKQTFDSPLPEKVEALYSEISIELAIAELQGLELLFEGQKDGSAEGYGLREALNAVEALYNGENLGDAIHNQFQTAKAAVAAIPGSLSEAVVTNRVPVEAAYNEIQKLVILLKTDMASALSILITYTDADGD
ncbi:MAG: imelysin family protein [Bacteroidetes bacterium]|nr:imelysin family protein [Bacteroidota bacterium]